MNGEMSDYQKVLQILDEKRITEYCLDDGSTQTTAELHSYLTRTMYQKRCKFDPLWNMLLVAGFREGEAYLGYTDLYGTHFADNYLATGLGMYMALPLMRNQWSEEMTEAQARTLLETALKICYYRDTRASNKVGARACTSRARSGGAPLCRWRCVCALTNLPLPVCRVPSPASCGSRACAGPDRACRRDGRAHRRADHAQGRVEPRGLCGGQRKLWRRRLVGRETTRPGRRCAWCR